MTHATHIFFKNRVGQVNYSVAKAGQIGMTKTIAKEWSRYGVRANTVTFGYIVSFNLNSSKSYLPQRTPPSPSFLRVNLLTKKGDCFSPVGIKRI